LGGLPRREAALLSGMEIREKKGVPAAAGALFFSISLHYLPKNHLHISARLAILTMECGMRRAEAAGMPAAAFCGCRRTRHIAAEETRFDSDSFQLVKNVLRVPERLQRRSECAFA